MTQLPDFEIKASGIISEKFREIGIHTFQNATIHISNLRYGRNAKKDELETVFSDNCGTCSSKHALLKTLADENEFPSIKLMLGIFKMNKENTPLVAKTMKENNLDFIPEAHNYLKYQNTIFDFTRKNSNAADFENDLLHEIEINLKQISDYKVGFHKEFLKKWLNENRRIQFTLSELWKIREQCISDLSND